MFINDVIRFVQRHYPSEYDPVDMYKWCDEVSAMLLVEDRVTFREVVLPVFEDNSVLLPEDVKFEDVVSVFADGHYIPKRDVRFSERRLCCFASDNFIPEAITVVYRKPFRPIRLIKYTGASEFCPTVDGEALADTVKLTDSEFIKGDTVLFLLDGEQYGPCNILSVEPDPDDLHSFLLTFGEGEITEEIAALDDPLIMRVITDQTVCAAPYDTMYEDYVLAKICFFQHDSSGYNQHMNSFNSRLLAYKKWLIDKLPHNDGKFYNYW